MILETERLALRPLQLSDISAVHDIFGDAEVMRFGDGPQTKQWIQDWLMDRIGEYDNDSGTLVWAVVHQDSHHVIGYCGLFCFPDVCGQPETEIGYRFARRYWGYGYATEAAQAVRDYALTSLGITRLIAIIDPSNVASIHVAKKLGMQYEKDVMFAGYNHPDYVYAFVKREVVDTKGVSVNEG